MPTDATKTRRKLESFMSLPVGWHYGKGGPISPEIIDLGLRTEAMLRDAGWPETDCFPGCDGEVQVTGYRPAQGLTIAVEITGGTYDP